MAATAPSPHVADGAKLQKRHWWSRLRHSRHVSASAISPSSDSFSSLSTATGATQQLQVPNQNLLYPLSSNNTTSDTASAAPPSRPLEVIVDPFIFGQPLDAAVERSSTRVISRSQSGAKIIYGPLPVLVAVCGTYLRENGINTQGIFRLSGSAKRVRQLQQVFASPPDFGAKISWQGYTVHDASSILRRYLNSLPEPIVPLDEYDNFRAPFEHASDLASSQNQTGTGGAGANSNSTATMRKKDIISVVQQLIFHLPVTNRQLLLYILDLLEQFSRHSKKNLMPAANLAAVFQPCILLHPQHDQSPEQYRISQDCLVFMIENLKYLKPSGEDAAAAAAEGTTAYEVLEKNSGLRNARRALSSGSNFAGLFKLSNGSSNSSKDKENERDSMQIPIFKRGTLRRSNTVPINLDRATATNSSNANGVKPLAKSATSVGNLSSSAAVAGMTTTTTATVAGLSNAATSASTAPGTAVTPLRNPRWSLGGSGRRSQSSRSSMVGTPELLSSSPSFSSSSTFIAQTPTAGSAATGDQRGQPMSVVAAMSALQRSRSGRSFMNSSSNRSSGVWGGSASNSPAMTASEFAAASDDGDTHSIQRTPEPFQRPVYEQQQQQQQQQLQQQQQRRSGSFVESENDVLYVPKRTNSVQQRLESSPAIRSSNRSSTTEIYQPQPQKSQQSQQLQYLTSASRSPRVSPKQTPRPSPQTTPRQSYMKQQSADSPLLSSTSSASSAPKRAAAPIAPAAAPVVSTTNRAKPEPPAMNKARVARTSTQPPEPRRATTNPAQLLKQQQQPQQQPTAQPRRSVDSTMLSYSPRKSTDMSGMAPSRNKPRRQGSISRALFGIVTRRPTMGATGDGGSGGSSGSGKETAAAAPPLPRLDGSYHKYSASTAVPSTTGRGSTDAQAQALAGAGAAFHRHTQSLQPQTPPARANARKLHRK